MSECLVRAALRGRLRVFWGCSSGNLANGARDRENLQLTLLCMCQEPLRQPLRAAMWLQAARPQNCRGHTLRCCTSSRSSESGLGGSGWMRGRASPLRPPLCSAPPRASPAACRLAALPCADWEPLSLLRRPARPCGSCAGAAGLGFRSCGDGGDEPCAAKLGAPPPSGAPADGSAAGGEPPAWVTACPETQQHHMQARVRG